MFAVNSVISKKGNQLRLSFMLVGQFSVLSLRSIVFLIDGIFTSWFRFFISRRINILFSFFNQRKMIKIVHDCSKIFNKNEIVFLLLILIVVLFVNKMHIYLNMQFFMVFATAEIALFFAMTEYVSILSIRLVLNLTSFGSKTI